MMEVRIQYFAAAREAAGCATELLLVREGATLVEVRRAIAERHPAVASLERTLRFAVDEQFAAEPESPLPFGAVVAVLPPVSGG
jgi:molybdopterin converting factor subunit 1